VTLGASDVALYHSGFRTYCAPFAVFLVLLSRASCAKQPDTAPYTQSARQVETSAVALSAMLCDTPSGHFPITDNKAGEYDASYGGGISGL